MTHDTTTTNKVHPNPDRIYHLAPMHHDDEVKCEKRGMDAQPPKPVEILHIHSDDASRDQDDGVNEEKKGAS